MKGNPSILILSFIIWNEWVRKIGFLRYPRRRKRAGGSFLSPTILFPVHQANASRDCVPSFIPLSNHSLYRWYSGWGSTENEIAHALALKPLNCWLIRGADPSRGETLRTIVFMYRSPAFHDRKCGA